MTRIGLMQILATLGVMLCCSYMPAEAQTIEELERQVEEESLSLQNKEKLAEGYLNQCELEKSLRVWREILEDNPENKRAQFVVSRLTLQALDLDSHLEVIETLLAKGITKGTDWLLESAARRAATDSQKAQILYFQGLLAERMSNEAQSRASFQTAIKLYPDTVWGARSAITLALSPWANKQPGEPTRLLRSVVLNEKLDETVRQEANFHLLLIDSAGWTKQQRIAGLRQLLRSVTAAKVKRQVLEKIIDFVVEAHGNWCPEAVEAAGAFLQAEPPYGQGNQMLSRLSQLAVKGRDFATLNSLLKVLAEVKLNDQTLARKAAFIRVEGLISRGIIEDDTTTMRSFLSRAGKALDELASEEKIPVELKRIWQLRGRLYLGEAQKTAVLEGANEALPVILRAKNHYLGALTTDPQGCLKMLEKIGMLLEHIQEWEVAVALYREVADEFPQMPQGAKALLKVARLYEQQLNAPMAALDVYAEYAARYPAELPYRQLDVGRRLQRLGYVNLLDFQKRTGLTPDGIFGPRTRKKLAKVEGSFDVIRVQNRDAAGILRGQFVHPTMFRIARQLEHSGRHYEAIRAYLLALNLFPSKSEADDALLAVGRLFRGNMLFEEALGAYSELMEYFPKGNVTSEAYVESASCLENLGRWKEAKELYKLYAKKFPRYKHVKLCRNRIGLLDEIQQYEDFLANNSQSPKAPEAQYQIASIVYKEFKNYTKAAVEFTKVAEHYPEHVRAADGLFTAGVAYMRVENFAVARKVFSEVVARYPENRLVDDAQYWIGHSYEYKARALGKLDEKRIVLKRRSLQQEVMLLGDISLRRRYYPQAQAGPELPQDVWTTDALGVLTSGSKRDRVNADLFQAIRAYRRVVDEFKMGDMAGNALHRIGVIHTEYLKDPEKGFEAYQELLAHYPGTKEAVNALYKVGAYYLKKKEYDKAVKSYQQFIYNYSTDTRVENAMLAIAQCYMEKKTWDKALDAYQSYLNKFPQGKDAAFARAQAAWIRTYYY